MKWIGLIFALFVAAVAAFMVIKFSGNSSKPVEQYTGQTPMQVQPQAAPEVRTVDVYVAANFIPIGTVIEENMLDTQPWPEHLALEGFIVGPEQGKTIVGKVTRSPFQAREPFINSKLVNPDDPNFLAGVLPKGMRVVTISTDGIAGVAGFIFPGDRVDILITHRVLEEGVDASSFEDPRDARDYQEDVTETLLSNVPVLAVDQRSSAGLNADQGVIIPQSVSLEVTPEDAQRIRLAAEVGELSMALRSLEDKDTIENIAITRIADLSQYQPTGDGSASKKKVGSGFIPVTIVRGTEVSNEESKEKRDEDRDERRGEGRSSNREE